jgi:excisionase family DNA binding protein
MEKYVLIEKEELKKLISEAVIVALAEHEALKSDLPKNPFLNIVEASHYLGLSKNTLYQYTSERYIPFINFGKKLYFIKEDLDNWILKHRFKTRAELTAEHLAKQSSNQ